MLLFLYIYLSIYQSIIQWQVYLLVMTVMLYLPGRLYFILHAPSVIVIDLVKCL